MALFPYPMDLLGLSETDVEPVHLSRLDAAETAARNCGVTEARLQRDGLAAIHGAPVDQDDPDFLEFVTAAYEDSLGLACRRRRGGVYAASGAAGLLLLWAGYQIIKRAS